MQLGHLCYKRVTKLSLLVIVNHLHISYFSKCLAKTFQLSTNP